MAQKENDILSNVYVAAPCNVGWENLPGDERVRSCNQCSKNVYNISDMTKEEAQAFLKEYGITRCMRMYMRQDGTIITDDCPVGLRKLRDGCKKAAKIVSSMTALVLSISAAYAQAVLPPSMKCKSKIENPQKPEEANPIRFTLGRPAFIRNRGLPPYDMLVSEPHALGNELSKLDDKTLLEIKDKDNSSQITDKSFALSARVEELDQNMTIEAALTRADNYAAEKQHRAAESFYRLAFKFLEYYPYYGQELRRRITINYAHLLNEMDRSTEAADLESEYH